MRKQGYDRPITVTILTLAFCSFGIAQIGSPAFEVASVKRSPPPSADFRMVPGSPVRVNANDPMYFRRKGATFRFLIEWAYNIQDYQLAGAPVWMESEHYDVDAKSEAPATRDQMRLMLRTLLADRFRLSVHPESKQLPAYALVVGKEGIKTGHKVRLLSAAEAVDARSRLGGPGQNIIVGDLKQFASNLTDLMNPRTFDPATGAQLPQMEFRPVVDQTGLDGVFEFTLTWKAGPSTTKSKLLTTFRQFRINLASGLNLKRPWLI